MLNEIVGSRGKECAMSWKEGYIKKEFWKINITESKYCTWLALPTKMA